MEKFMAYLLRFSFLIAIIEISPILAQNNILVKIDNINPEKLIVEGFRLNSDQKLDIEAVGLHRKEGSRELIYGTAWILDAESREVIWQMKTEKFRGRKPKIQESKEEVYLPAGNYEAYYSSYPYFGHWSHWHHRGISGLISDFFDMVFDGSDHDTDYDERISRQFKIIVSGNGTKLTDDELSKSRAKFFDKPDILLLADVDNLYLWQGFELTDKTKLRVRVSGEARDDGNYDYGWIVDTQTHKKVWEFDFHSSDRSGGAEKNRTLTEIVTMPAGRFAAVYITDDSHSPYEWNSTPPYDPAFWGMTIAIVDPRHDRSLKKFDYQNLKEDDILFSLNRMQDDDFDSKGFSLKKPMDLRVYAIGEGRDGEMFDYGWIVDTKTHRTVWEMDFYHTEHAGGAQKNRIIDTIISLEEGSYVLYYVTDGSHSFRDWNSSQPFDTENWGITILAPEKGFSRKDIEEYDEKTDPKTLSKLTKIRDDEYKREEFTLKTDTEVRIYALGEGIGGQMYDYGWIEDANTGRTVWEMAFRKTDHAGGANKNRLYDDTILLKAGTYIVYYESDDSHSFNSWNDTPPRDPMNWGISLYLANSD
jgi:hypothetical protein